MPAADLPGRPSIKSPGRVSRALMRLLMRRATIAANEPMGDRFRLVTLAGPDLKAVEWAPGQKIQIAMGSAFVARTYTPIEWNDAAGTTRILCYAHGDGPGSAWVLGVRPGDECDLFGPRRSLDVRHLTCPLAIFGDETSIGLACALRRRDQSRPVSCHFEVEDARNAGRILTELGIGTATTLFERRAGDGHIADMEECLPMHVEADAGFVLTGKADTIQRLRQSLKRHGVPATRIVTKAYWAPGKTGLD